MTIGSTKYQSKSRLCATDSALVVSTAVPPALHSLDYSLFHQDIAQLEEDELSELEDVAYVSDLPWVLEASSTT